MFHRLCVSAIILMAAGAITACEVTVELGGQPNPKERLSFNCKNYNPYYLECPQESRKDQ